MIVRGVHIIRLHRWPFPLSRLECSLALAGLTQNVIKGRPCAWLWGLIPHFTFTVLVVVLLICFWGDWFFEQDIVFFKAPPGTASGGLKKEWLAGVV